jgi:hypothetical protein
MDLGEVLSSSWKVFWNRKLLWWFGIVPPLIFMIPALVMAFIFFNPRFFNNNSDPFFGYVILTFGIVYLLLVVAYMFLFVLADVSIVKGTLLFDQKGEKPATGGLIQQSKPYYWRVFGVYAIFIGAYIILWVGLTVFMSLAAALTMGFGMFCIFPLFFLLIPIMYLASAFLELARTSIIHDNVGIGECLKRTWALFKAKFWKIVLVAVILYFGMSIIMMLLYIPLYGFMTIPFFQVMAQNSAPAPDFDLQIFSSMRWMFVIFFPVLTLVSGIVTTFIRETWAVTYVRLSRQPAAAPVQPVAPMEPVAGIQ